MCVSVMLLALMTFLFGAADQHVKIDRKTIFSEFEIGDFLQTWNRTKTADGDSLLFSFLLNPIKNKKMLIERQNLIKRLVNEREAFNKIQAALADIAATERYIFTYFQKEGNDYLKTLNASYSTTVGIRSIANSNALTQEGWFAYKLASSFLPLFGAIGGMQLFNELIDRVFDVNHKIDWYSFTRGAISEVIKKNLPFRNTKPWLGSLTPKQAKDAWFKGYWFDSFSYLKPSRPVYKEGDSKAQHMIDNAVYPVGMASSFFLSIMPTFFYDVGFVQSVDTSIKNLKGLFSTITIMQHHCCMINKYIRAVRTILQVQSEYGLFSNVLPNISPVLSDKYFQEIMSVFSTETFDQPSRFLFYHGRVLHAQKLIYDHTDLFVPLTDYVGMIDVFMSIAHMIRECENMGHKFSFVDYVDSENGAIIDAKNAWHPLFFGNAVRQDVHLGATSDTQHMIITGPNWSGKSIYLKTVGLIAYLAQTLTIVPADSCSLTLFDQIESCLDPKGDIAQNLSKFKKQQNDLERFKNIVSESSSTSNKVLICIDEILSGTVDDMIALRSKEFGTSIEPTKNAIVMITTHVFEPTELEGLTNGLFKNFHVEIIPQEDESFIRTFCVVRGPATWWFDPKTKMLRVKFIDWVNSKKPEQNDIIANTIQ